MAYISSTTVVATASSATTVVSSALPVTAGNLLVVFVTWVDAPGTITCSVTDSSGNTYTAGAKLRNSGTTASQMFYAYNIAGGSPVVTATFSAAAPYRTLIVEQYNNMAAGNPIDTIVTPATGNDASPVTGTFDTTQTNETVIAFLACNPPTGASSGYTLRNAINYAGSSDKFSAAALTGETAGFALSASAQWNIHAMTFKLASSETAVTIGRNDASLYYSPYTWDDDGTAKIANSNGSYLRFNFTGTSLAINIVALSGLSVYPTFRVYVDNQPAVDVTPTSGQTALTIATGLSAGTHSARVVLKGMPLNGRWDLTAALKLTSLTLDAGASVSAYTPRSKRMIAYGDSISEGERVLSTAAPPSGSDGTKAIWPSVAEALDAELGQLGYGSVGYEVSGAGSVPSFLSGWSTFNSGARSRLSGGLFTPAPDYIFEMHGTNGTTTQADVATMIANFRAAAPSAFIFIVVPPGGFAKTVKTAAVNAAISGGDSKVKLIDLSVAEYASGLSSFGAATEQGPDGLHPYERSNMRLAAKAAALVQHEVEPRRFSILV